METIFVARQPIYDKQLAIVGYELLYRDSDSDTAVFADATHASSQLIVNSFLGFGLESLVGSTPAFINLTHDFLVGAHPVPMRPEQIVLEVRAEERPDEQVLQGLQRLAGEGYAIALEGFVYRPGMEPLLELASIVKFDLHQHQREPLREQLEQCRQHGVTLLAQKVETHADLAFCRELGFDLFQGFLFARPQTLRGRSAVNNRRVILQLLNRLEETDTDIGALERVLFQDAALAYKLLRYSNCAAYTRRREIRSIREALQGLGAAALKKWATLLLLASRQNYPPQAPVTKAMKRAVACELLAQRHPGISSEQAFTAGLFSTLDTVMGVPMAELLDTVSLSVPLKFALLDREGELGHLLQTVLRHEMGQHHRSLPDGCRPQASPAPNARPDKRAAQIPCTTHKH